MVWRVLLNNVLKLLLGGELVLMYGVFTELDFYKVGLLLVWFKLVWLADPGLMLSAAHSRSAPLHFLVHIWDVWQALDLLEHEPGQQVLRLDG